MQNPKPQTQSVDQIVNRVKRMVELDSILSNVAVEGELLDFKRHTSGHVYFTLGGTQARVSCVMFKSEASRLLLWPQEGDRVLLLGRMDVYPQRGTLQLYARSLMPLGKGAIARAKEELRQILQAEGLFDAERKRPMPPYPKTIACITSPTGAAIKDVINVSKKRWPLCDVIIVPTLVQGLEAPKNIVNALNKALTIKDLDAIMLLRGGGSKDDLSPFDDESVVRALAASRVPTVTGLGHDVDLSLCDMAADLHAPTPSAAAERLLPDIKSVYAGLENAMQYLNSCVTKNLMAHDFKLQTINSKITKIIKSKLENTTLLLDAIQDRCSSLIKDKLKYHTQILARSERILKALSPQANLNRGYSLCYHEGKLITSSTQVKQKDKLQIRLKDGNIEATVNKKSN